MLPAGPGFENRKKPANVGEEKPCQTSRYCFHESPLDVPVGCFRSYREKSVEQTQRVASPQEKQRMLDLLKRTKANGVLFISGDRHWAELSRLDRPGDYPLYDLTSSALTETHRRGTPT